jgi:hypothetical protein
MLRTADEEARGDSEAAAAAAIRDGFEAKANPERPLFSAESPRRAPRAARRTKRQLGDRLPPDPRRPTSLDFDGPSSFGPKNAFDAAGGNVAGEAETYEVLGQASFSLNRFGALTVG